MSEVREPEVAYGRSKFTVEEYLRFERTASERHEYYQGEIFRMHGHGDLLANVNPHIRAIGLTGFTFQKNAHTDKKI